MTDVLIHEQSFKTYQEGLQFLVALAVGVNRACRDQDVEFFIREIEKLAREHSDVEATKTLNKICRPVEKTGDLKRRESG